MICANGCFCSHVSSFESCSFCTRVDPWRRPFSYQLLKCGTSAGANYEEADDGSSDRDTLAKRRITLLELKETRFRLRVLRHCELLSKEHDPVINESASSCESWQR